jgi:transcriptional regulator with XRE-family HTH domain
MVEIAHSIDLDLPRKLKDREYRRRFFLAEASARIASQLVALRKRRGLNQTQLAELADTQQPAISRAERADYHNWSFNTLRSIADALDARIRVTIEAAEDVMAEYEPAKERGESENALRAFNEKAGQDHQALDTNISARSEFTKDRDTPIPFEWRPT